MFERVAFRTQGSSVSEMPKALLDEFRPRSFLGRRWLISYSTFGPQSSSRVLSLSFVDSM